MDWKLIGDCVALFTLGFAYGIWIELYVDMVRYRRRWRK